MDYNDYFKNSLKGIVDAPDTIGTPIEDALYAPGPQERIDSCAIRSQQHILSMYGINVSEDALVQDAIRHSEYSVHDNKGTYVDDVGNLLERNGIDVNRYENATIAHLISELGQGHKIIVGIDAYEAIADTLPARIAEMQKDAILEQANHAVVVVDVDPHTFDVSIVDPADGRLHVIPIGRFTDAWQDSNCYMMATKESPEEYLSDNNALNLGGIDMKHDFDNDALKASYPTDIDTLDTAAPQPRLGSLGQVAGVAPQLGSLGHVAGVAPQLGSLGHVAGVAPVLSNADLVLDINGDGSIDTLAFDADGDGVMDAMTLDTNYDGLPDSFAFDTNGDGVMDTLATSIDLDGDGLPDLIGVDLDGDGTIDCMLSPDDFSDEY